MKICNSGTGIILIFWSLFSFWFGRKRRSRRFEKLSNNLDKFLIKIPLGCIIQWQELGSPIWMGVFGLRSWYSQAQCFPYVHKAQSCSNLPDGLSGCPSAWTPMAPPLHIPPATKFAQILTKWSVQITFWEIDICPGRSTRLDTYDLPHLRHPYLCPGTELHNFIKIVGVI